MHSHLQRLAISILVLVAVPLSLAQKKGEKSETIPPAAVGTLDFRVAPALSHANLDIFVVCGADAASGAKFITLQEALDAKKIRVIETGEVGELKVENLSQDEIYIESGEIVRGGKQDRLLAVDLILEPKSGKVAIKSFCVEAGRWQQRGGESAGQFSSAANQAPVNSIKLAAKKSKNQGEVWSGVARAQEKLGKVVGGGGVKARESETSLELSLNNEKLKERAAEYVKSLAPRIDAIPDSLGVILAINGRPYSADIYGSHELFQKRRGKLLEAAATAAVAALDEKKSESALSPEGARAFVLAAASGKAEKETVTQRVWMTHREQAGNSLFETIDAKSGAWIHINCLAREEHSDEEGKEQQQNAPVQRKRP